MLETLDSTIRIGSTPSFPVYFDLYLYSAYAAHYVYYIKEVIETFLPLKFLVLPNFHSCFYNCSYVNTENVSYFLNV